MYCKNCGSEIDDKAVVCPKCGVSVSGKPGAAADDAPSAGFAVLGFFFPLIGLILYIIWHTDYPKKARSCGKGALIGVIVSAAVGILSVILVSCVAAMAVSSTYSVAALL